MNTIATTTTTVVATSKTKGDYERKFRGYIFGENGMIARRVKVFDNQMRFTADALHSLGFRDALQEFEENGWPRGSNGK